MRIERIATLLSLIISLIALGIPIALHITSIQERQLTATMFSADLTGLLEGGLPNDFQMTFRGRRLAELVTQWVFLSNTGDLPIELGDFNGPIRIQFGSDVEILAAESVCEQPDDLDAEVSIDADTSAVLVRPLLMNPGDRFCITAYIAGSEQDPVLRARIAGVTVVEKRITPGARGSRGVVLRLLSTLIVCYVAQVFLFGRPARIRNIPWYVRIPGTGVVGLAAGVLIGAQLGELGVSTAKYWLLFAGYLGVVLGSILPSAVWTTRKKADETGG